jgi:hypothetical protein
LLALRITLQTSDETGPDPKDSQGSEAAEKPEEKAGFKSPQIYSL